MKRVWRNMGDKTKKWLFSKSVSIPVTADLLLILFKRQLDKEQAVHIHNLDVSFQEDFIRISGFTKQLLMHVYVEMDVRPVQAKGRAIYVQIIRMKPLNGEWMKSKILHKPPFAVYEDRMLIINLNEIEKIKAVPFGNIKGFTMKEGKLFVTIGI